MFARERGTTATAVADLSLLVAMTFIVITLIVIVFLADPKEEDDVSPPGELFIEVVWPPELNVDVDLWVQVPGETPVGYSNLGGVSANLNRDDLGNYHDPLPVNYEYTTIRKVKAGAYVVNVHYFASHVPRQAPPSIEVTMSLRQRDKNGKMIVLASNKVTLRRQGEELTVLRWRMDGDGMLVPGSFHDRPCALRSYRRGVGGFNNQGTVSSC